MIASCVLFTGQNAVTIGEVELRSPAPTDVVVDTELSCISPGTELRCLAGMEPSLGPTPWPFVPGYSLIGRVTQAGAGCESLIGRRVCCAGDRRLPVRSAWGGHIARAVVPGEDVIVVPETLAPEDAVLLKLAAIAVRGVRLAEPQPDETVVVVGLGAIGQLSARLFVHAGARVYAADKDEDRVAVAQRAGATGIWVPDRLEERIQFNVPDRPRIVVDATGSAPVLRESIKLVRSRPWTESDEPGGVLVVQGSYSGDVVVPSAEAFSRELTMVWPRDSQRQDIAYVLDALETGALSFGGILSGMYPFTDAPRVYSELSRRGSRLMTAAFRW